MAHSAQCYLPRFSPSSCGPRRPVSIKVRTTPFQNLELLTAWRREEIYSFLQTAWALLLYRYIGSKDVCFGYQYLDGSGTVNSSTVSLTVNEGDSLRRVQNKVADGSLHQEFGTDLESDSTHDGYVPYNTMLMIRICRDSLNGIGNSPLQPVLAMALQDKTRVRLHVKILEDDISLFLESWSDEISTEQMNSITSHLEKTISQIVSGDDIAVGALDRFSEQDWSRICKFNAKIPKSHDYCIHEKIQEQVVMRPRSEAVCAWDGSLTYSELDLLASRVAFHLQAQGVGPEVRVALCFDKSKWNIVAVLGVLKAGGAFVPLDPTHPTSRLRSLVQSVRAEFLICSRNHEDNLKVIMEKIMPLDDATLKELPALPEERQLSTEVKSHHAAYVIFTSGSTGEPKGTLVEHRAFASGAAAHAPQLRVSHNSRLLQFAAHTFDASLIDILTTLMQGGCICVPSEEQRLNEIVQVINEMGVNHASLTPTFIDFIDPTQVPGLKTLVLVGEAMSQSHLNTWSRIELINGFGPTESSVAATVNNQMTRFSDSRDIGLPIGVRIWIVDPEDHDKLVPVGCVGELILEGPTLARGYVNNPEKTAEVFIHNPIWAQNEGETQSDRRFYKTGDLVRYNSDAGSLTYVGRKDTQIKLHGQRIELGEIEDNLNTDPAVKNCLVFLPKSGAYEGKLVAVLSLSTEVDSHLESDKAPLKILENSKKTSAVTDIRHRLSSRLPTYMIPSGWLCVESLPQLASRKLDRKATADWVAGMEEGPDNDLAKLRNSSNREAIRSTNVVEDRLASIWSRVLNIPKRHISLDESFLSLGGESLAAITCMGLCRKQGLGVTVQEMLRSKSIRDLALHVTETSQPAVYEETIDEPFGLTPIQKLHFKVRKEGKGHFNQGVLTRLNQPISDYGICRAIETLIKRHSMLRARFTDVSAEDGVRQCITQDIAGSYRFRSHNEISEHQIQQVISNSQLCIDAFAGPMMAADVFHVSGGDNILSMTAHHLVVDTVSWRIILDELEKLLLNPDEDLSQSGSLPFQTWSRIQEMQIQEAETTEQAKIDDLPTPELAYWGLENCQNTYGDVNCETFEMSPEDTHALLMECHKSLETEPIDVFLASLLYGFRKAFADRSLPVIYNEGPGREVWDPTIDISRTVGWFTILQPILISSLALDDPVDAVTRVKDLRRRVSDNGRQEFTRRVLAGGPEKCGHPGSLEISFNYVGQHRDSQRKYGLFQLMDQMSGETGRGGGAADFGEETPRFALFEISALAVQGRLRFSFSFNRHTKHQELIRTWVASCQNTLKYLGNKLQFLEPRPTLSSFPLLSLNYEELETILSKRLPAIGIQSADLVENIYPCSRMQEAILLSCSRDAGLYAVHNTVEVKCLQGKPDASRLMLAWQKVVSRHPMLRTIFVENFTTENLFCQVVLKAFDARCSFVKCLSDSDVLATLDQQQPMSYHEHQPSHRFTICETANGSLFCRIEINHTSMDGSSISLIFRDLQLAYSEELDDHKPAFKNFIHYLQSTPEQDTIDYWGSYLSKLKPCHFPVLTDGAPAPKQLKTMRLNFEPFEELQNICEQNGLTLSTAFRTGWGLTLRSFCNTDDVCFSYATSLRDLPVEDIESVVGPVISLLACRMNASGSILLGETLHQVQNDYMEQLPYKHASLIDIQHALKLPENLFNTVISFRQLPSFKDSPREAIDFEELGTIYEPAEFPVFINVEVADNEVRLDFNYWTTALSDGQAQSVTHTFLKHLENIIYFQDKEVGLLDGMSDWTQNKLAIWNSRVPQSDDQPIHDILDDRAKMQPNAIAVVDEDGSFTYAKVNELSSILATYLIKLGVSSGALVPIDFGNSRWQIVSVLAVLKAGGLCVPMSEGCIQNANQWFIDNGVQFALATPTRVHVFEGTIAYVIPVEASLFKYLPSLNEEFHFSVDLSNDAYVVFTSGEISTPRPVVLNHANILARAKAFASALGLNKKTRSLQFSAYKSDMFIEETFGVLLYGGCLCIPSDSSPQNLSVSINALHVNCISLTPSIASYLHPSDVPEVKILALFGEASVKRLNEIWSPKVQLHTFYGTTESSLISIHKSLIETSPNEQLIGSSNCCLAWIVDSCDHDTLVPIGCTGELVLEGPSVAKGYLDQEQLANSFIMDPRWISALEQSAGNCDEEIPDQTKQPRRMFKTGDLARYNSDGSLVFMGRKSKESGSISQGDMWQMEQRINAFLSPEYRCAVETIDYEQESPDCPSVFVLFEKDDDTIFESSRAPISRSSPQFYNIVAKLHTHLSQSLPSNQVPNMYFPVSRIPLSQTGKLDRQKLRNSALGLSDDARLEYNFCINGGNKQAPQGGELRGLWEKALGLKPGSVGAEDSFFRLGGDSLSAMKLVGAAHSCGISLTVAEVYANPILKAMEKCCGISENETVSMNVQTFSLLSDSVPREEILADISDQSLVPQELISDVYPCSPVQEGLLTLSIKQQGAYIGQPIYKLADGLNIEKFKAAWQETVNELDILRTRIVHTDSMGFLQAVLKKESISWIVADTVDEVLDGTFGLSNHNGGQLASYAIVQSEDSPISYFVWTIHHALYDGWSVPLILRKVEEFYSNALSKTTTLPYKNFISYLEDTDMSKSDEFWKHQLSNLSCSPFPQNKTPSPDAVRVGNRHHSSIGVSRSHNILGLTFPEIIRAAWAIVVSVHTNSSDVCFGETLMGRNVSLPGVTDIAGPVLTTVPTRVQVDNDVPVTQYLQKVRELTTMTIPHQHSGLQRIRKLSGHASVACNFQNLLVIQTEEGDLNESIWASSNDQASGDFFTHPLTVECKINESSLAITLHHDEVVLDSWLAERLIHQFSHVLEQLLVVSNDDVRKVGDLELLSAFDKKDISRWNQRDVPAVERCAHDIIKENCSLQPKAKAVCAWDGELSYKELHDLASSFANYLSYRGVGPEMLVPICMDKSLWVVVAILGVLIAGGAYVPLDPSHPTSRHTEIIEQVDARVILCSPQYHKRYAGLVKTIIPVNKETIRAYGALTTETKKPHSAQPSNMAVSIFTSGSTGRPKGIILDHRALASSGMAFGPMVGMNQTSRSFQFASLAFDAAIMEIIVTLMHGGCICIPSEEERLNNVVGVIQRMKVTWTFLTPSIASIIEPSMVPSLEVLVCGGEKLSREVITKWAHCVRLMNGYGPTETTIFAVINPEVSTNTDAACIGYGIPCTLTWIVDPENHDRLSPLGAIGELALEGPALAREYLRNPEKTADAFVTEPAWTKNTANSLPSPRRIYKTGDLVRYNPDGSIVCIGRKDHQVKLHGQRMELGEIEHRLHEDPRVRHAIVIMPAKGPLKQRLVTIMSMESLNIDKSIMSDETCELVNQATMARALPELVYIQKNLERQLPIYMVPQTWAVIKKLPMLVSGKLDRKRITQWIENVDERTYGHIMQYYDDIKRGDFEPKEEEKDHQGAFLNSLREIITQVLNFPSHKIDVSRSFVSLGGDSITGMTVVSKARKQGIEVTLHNVLQSKSITELAAMSSAKKNTIQRNEKSGELFELSPIQRLYFESATAFDGSARFNQSMTVRITRRIKPENLKQAIKAIIQRHSIFRARFIKSRGGKWQQKVKDDVESSYRFRIHTVNSPTAMFPMIGDSQQSLNIENGPIFAADLFEIQDGKQILFLVANHLCVDMVSWRIVLQDIEEFLESGSLSSEKPLSFQSWCEVQMESSKIGTRNADLPFSIETPNLSYWGMEGVPNVYGNVKMESFTLSEDATTFVLERGQHLLRAEAIDVVLSTVIHAFRQVFNDRDVPTIYNEGHGRDVEDPSVDLSRTVGWFTTICPLRVNRGLDIMETLKYVKDTRRQVTTDGQAYFAQNMLHETGATKFPVPFEIIFNYLGKLQQLERNDSLFQHFGNAFDSERLEVTGDMGPKTPRFALLEVSAIIVKEKLHVSFTYNRQMQHESQVLEWMAECKRILEEDFLYSRDRVPEPTLTDYPLLNLTYDGLRNLVKDTIPKVGIKSWDEIEDVYPCSSVQEGILLSQLRDPQKYMFHVVLEARHSNQRTKIDPAQLRKAWMMVVNRHQVLRTLFVDSNSKGSSFDQVVIKSIQDETVEFQCEDDVAFKALDNIQLCDINKKRSSRLTQQLTICQTTSGRVLIKLEMSHAIIDGGSFAIIMRDLALAYNNTLASGPGPRFSEYITYSRKQDQKDALAYWMRYLSGVQPCHLSFSTEARGNRQLGSRMMDFNRFPELLQFCEKHSVTLATLTLTAWAIVLRKFTGSNDVSFGYPSTGRDAPVSGIQDAVGIFINMMCCRVNFVANHTLLDVSKMVQQNHIKNIPHQNTSLASIQHQLGHQGQALFNTTISIQKHSESNVVKKDMISFDAQHEYDPTEYPVTVNVETARGHEGILLRFWTDAVSENQAKDLADSIAKVFTCLVEEPSQLVSELVLAGEPLQIRNQPPKGPAPSDIQLLDHDYLQKLIDQRVNEAIDRMIKTGKLVLAQPDDQDKNQTNEYQLKGSDSFPADDTRKMTLSDSVPTLMGDKETCGLESRLRKLWNTALGRSEAAVKHQDSFFKLGGDSITAMKMVGVAREEGLGLTVSDVFTNPVFGDMLAIVRARDSSASSSASSPPLTPENEKVIETPFILSRPGTPNELTVLRSSEVDSSSLRAGISPKIGVFRGGIADVLPVTDFQALSLTASLFRTRWMLNYFFLEGQGPLDIRRLRESFLHVVDAFEILRTVFVCFHGQFFQVILRKVRPEIFVCETDQSLDDYTESLQQQDRAQIPRQGEQYVQFHIVKKRTSGQHRILIRMHHAQFDGVCLPRIMSAIKLGYEGSPIPPTPSFSNYMRVLPASITPEHYQHWKALLKGSQMTEVIQRQAPNNFQYIGSFTEQKKTIHFPPTVLENVTIATVMQSAWAMTLAKISAHADVVFCLIISGRNATIPGIEATVGPCLNMIPVRVKFGEHWTGLDLFRYLQDQQVANMPYESLGFREIIRHCTDWSDSTHFTTSVLHQNVEYEGQMQLDDHHYRMSGVGVIDNFTDFTLYSKSFPNEQKLDISLGYSAKGPIQSPFAIQVLDMVCETVKNLIANPNIPLPSPSTLRSLSCQAVNDLPRSSDEHFLSSHLNTRSISELLVHSDLLTQTWKQVLSSNNNPVPRTGGAERDQNPYQLNSSFFDLGGDLLSMAQVVWLLEQQGLQVRLEDLLEHPTFLGQLAVLALHNNNPDRHDEDPTRNDNSNNNTATISSSELITSSPPPGTASESEAAKALAKKGTWNPLGRAFTLARRFTRWGSVSSKN